MAILPRQFFLHDTQSVAQQLLGKVLCVRTPSGIRRSRIVEVEAYLGVKDKACHSYGGRRTERTEAMYLEGGHSYVYFIYGMYFCLNVVTGSPEHPEAVLIRGVEPLDLELHPLARKAALPTNGPGKLCRYYGIDRRHNGVKLFTRSSPLWLEEDSASAAFRMVRSKRIGVESYGSAKDRLLRFSMAGNRFVSRC